MGDDFYHTMSFPYNTSKSIFITHGVYHKDFSKRVYRKTPYYVSVTTFVFFSEVVPGVRFGQLVSRTLS